jgi:hypothetical protein
MYENSTKYLTSKETKIFLKIHDCELAHVRNSGKLKFIKKGNAFLYLFDSLEEYKNLPQTPPCFPQ